MTSVHWSSDRPVRTSSGTNLLFSKRQTWLTCVFRSRRRGLGGLAMNGQIRLSGPLQHRRRRPERQRVVRDADDILTGSAAERDDGRRAWGEPPVGVRHVDDGRVGDSTGGRGRRRRRSWRRTTRWTSWRYCCSWRCCSAASRSCRPAGRYSIRSGTGVSQRNRSAAASLRRHGRQAGRSGSSRGCHGSGLLGIGLEPNVRDLAMERLAGPATRPGTRRPSLG